MSMPRAVRHINETRTLESLRINGPMSRAGIARELGVTRSTASAIVASLAENGLVIESFGPVPDAERRTGRPGTNICLNADHALFLGIDVGVGRGSVAVVDFAAEVRMSREYRFPSEGADPAEVATLVAAETRAALSGLVSRENLRVANVTVPGLADFDGRVVRAPYLGWHDVPFLEVMRAALPEIEIAGLENDANAFAIADLRLSGRIDKCHAVYLFLDTGVGGCAVAGGDIVRGHSGHAGEFGHVIVGDRGYSKPALSTIPGSLESFIGRRALFARHRHYGGASISVADFLLALDGGEAAASATLGDWAHHLGRGLATLVSVLNPEKVVFSGPLAPLFQRADDAVHASLGAHLLAESHMPQLRLSKLGRDAPAIGGALLLQRDLFAYDRTLVFGA